MPDEIRRPRCWLKLGEAKVPCISATVNRSSQRRADTFTAELAIGETAQFGFDLAKWADYQPEDVSVVLSTQLDGSDEQVVMTGLIDEPEVTMETMTVSVSGRDKSALLLENVRHAKMQNQKIADVVKQVASEQGLEAQVDDISDFAGKKLNEDYAGLILGRTDFETLSSLADIANCRWYVEGNNLYFESIERDQDVYNVVWVPPSDEGPAFSNVLGLKISRNMSAARPHEHQVKSWHGYSKRLFKTTAKVKGVGKPIKYIDHHSGRDQEQVERLAKARVKNTVRHELNLHLTAPGDLTVSPRMKLQLTGTNTIYDQLFDIDTLTYRMGWGEGFLMDISAKAAKAGRDPDGVASTQPAGTKAATGTSSPGTKEAGALTGGGTIA